MKKQLILATMALAALFGSCSKDNTIETPNNESGAAALSFSFAKPQDAFVTRADIASPEEWNIDALDVYAAIGGTVEKLAATDYTMVEDTRTYTITMAQDWVIENAGQTANFYFTGNDATSAEGAHTNLTATVEADFRNALTNELGTTDGKLDPIAAPDGSTRNLLFSAVVENVKIQATINKTGHLKRREARFDIKNPLWEGDVFKVDQILVSDASTAAMIFPNGDPDAVTVDKLSHTAIAGLAEADYTDGLATSVFYLYPTELGTGKTQIHIIGSFDGESHTFIVDGTAIGNLIEANKRYTLVLDPTTLAFTLVVDDYDEGGEVPMEPGRDDTVTLDNYTDNFAGTGNGAHLSGGNEVFFFVPNDTNTITFDAHSKYGTNATVELLTGKQAYLDAVTVTKTNTVTTYAQMQTVDSYQVEIPALVAGRDDFYFTVTIHPSYGDGKQAVEFKRVWGGEDDILYFDPSDDYRLKLGKWGTDVTDVADLAYFKFGSVIGMIGDSNDTVWSPDYIKFNPSTLVPGVDITSYGNSSTGNNPPHIPGFVGTDYIGQKAIYGSYYTNFENIHRGKGDPCALIGLTGAEIAAATTEAAFEQLLDGRSDTDKEWRMPDLLETQQFFGGPKSGEWMYTVGRNFYNSAYPNAYTDNGSTQTNTIANVGNHPLDANGVFPAFGFHLPGQGVWTAGIGVAGRFDKLENATIEGGHWSATPYNTTMAIFGAFNPTYASTVSIASYVGALNIRCVREVR